VICRKLDPQKTKLIVLAMVFRLLVVPHHLDTGHDHQITHSWSKPEDGWIKSNVDAALLEDSDSLGLFCRPQQSGRGGDQPAQERFKTVWTSRVGGKGLRVSVGLQVGASDSDI
jgi:hypothetical protein